MEVEKAEASWREENRAGGSRKERRMRRGICKGGQRRDGGGQKDKRGRDSREEARKEEGKGWLKGSRRPRRVTAGRRGSEAAAGDPRRLPTPAAASEPAGGGPMPPSPHRSISLPLPGFFPPYPCLVHARVPPSCPAPGPRPALRGENRLRCS